MAAETRKRREKLLFLIIAGSISIFLLIIGGYRLVEFSDTTAFCGRLCHNVMSPEYIVHQASPHSRVACAHCHVGSGASYLVKSKISGVPMIVGAVTGKVPRPIPVPVENLRPARDTCEQCHWPQKFSGDLVRVHTTFGTDEANTRKVDTRVLRVGGGESATAQGIHWHIATKVWYLPMDESRQQVGWVGVQAADGALTEYVDPKLREEITPERIEKEKRLMDCVDCHNRATHVFQSPNELIDSYMAQDLIDKTLPYIKKKGLEALDPPNSSLAEAIAKVDAIREFYRTSYAEMYVAKKAAVERSIEVLKEVARLTTFPEMNVSWNSYIDNAGHQGTPGCFRCHGKLVATTGATKGSTIDAGCDSCHYFQLQR